MKRCVLRHVEYGLIWAAWWLAENLPYQELGARAPMTYRTNAPPATRPALTAWQRAVLRVLGDTACARFAWYRAYVGGTWTLYGGKHDPSLPFDPRVWQRGESSVCAICNLCERLRAIPLSMLRPGEARYMRDHRDHRCESYPWARMDKRAAQRIATSRTDPRVTKCKENKV